MFGGNFERSGRRPAEIEWWIRTLNGRQRELPALQTDVLAVIIDGLPGEKRLPDIEKFVGDFIAFVVAEKSAIACQFNRIPAGDDVEQQATVGEAIKGGRHTRG